MYCPNCGKELEEGAKYCSACETALRKNNDKNDSESDHHFKKPAMIAVLLALASVVILILLIGPFRLNTGSGTDGLEYENTEEGMYVKGYSGNSADLIIPDEYEGMPVVGVSGNAFDKTQIQTITLGKNIRSIEQAGFIGAENLSKVTITSERITINNGAFQNCRSLSEVLYKPEEGVITIYMYPFDYCDKFDGIIWQNQLIEKSLFNNYDNHYTHIHLDNDGTFYAEESFSAIPASDEQQLQSDDNETVLLPTSSQSTPDSSQDSHHNNGAESIADHANNNKKSTPDEKESGLPAENKTEKKNESEEDNKTVEKNEPAKKADSTNSKDSADSKQLSAGNFIGENFTYIGNTEYTASFIKVMSENGYLMTGITSCGFDGGYAAALAKDYDKDEKKELMVVSLGEGEGIAPVRVDADTVSVTIYEQDGGTWKKADSKVVYTGGMPQYTAYLFLDQDDRIYVETTGANGWTADGSFYSLSRYEYNGSAITEANINNGTLEYSDSLSISFGSSTNMGEYRSIMNRWLLNNGWSEHFTHGEQYEYSSDEMFFANESSIKKICRIDSEVVDPVNADQYRAFSDWSGNTSESEGSTYGTIDVIVSSYLDKENTPLVESKGKKKAASADSGSENSEPEYSSRGALLYSPQEYMTSRFAGEQVLSNSSYDDMTYLVPGLTDEELRIARNEIFARHGRLFKSADLQEYFNNCSWYKGYIPPDEFDEKQKEYLSPLERANVDLILAEEAARGIG